MDVDVFAINSTPGAVAAGQKTRIRCDATGLLLVGGGGGGGAVVVEFNPASDYLSLPGLQTSDVIIAAAATILSVDVFNASASVRFFQLFDAAAVPADTTVPDAMPLQVLPNSHASIEFAAGQGIDFATGISWASSSTQITKTITGVADMIVQAQLRS